MPSGLRFGLLGNLEVFRGETEVPLARRKLRILLATLLLEANRTVPFERIIERLWGEEPTPSARSTTHVYAMRLRRALGDSADNFQLVQTRPNGYLLEIEPDRLDVAAFHDLLGRARRAAGTGDLVGESALLGKALALWRGPALLDIPSASLQRSVVPRLTEERLQATERRLAVDLRLNRHADLVGELTELTREHPTRERFWLLLMRSLAGLGRPAEALAAYRDVYRLFRDELGIEPGEEIQRLHHAILSGDEVTTAEHRDRQEHRAQDHPDPDHRGRQEQGPGERVGRPGPGPQGSSRRGSDRQGSDRQGSGRPGSGRPGSGRPGSGRPDSDGEERGRGCADGGPDDGDNHGPHARGSGDGPHVGGNDGPDARGDSHGPEGGHGGKEPAGPGAGIAVTRPVTPSHLPPDLRRLIGRTARIAELTGELAPAGGDAATMPVVVLSGPPGVGKTALAVHVAHRVRGSYPDGQLYANLQGYSAASPLAPTVVLARFLRALGVPANQIPADQDEQVSLYRSLLAQRRVLVVLDNAAEPRQVRPLLPGQPGCATLVTSRNDLRGLVAIDGARQFSLAPLDGGESHAVLAAVLGTERVDAEPAAVEELAAQCGRLPLALRIAAANLQANPHQRIADYVRALRVRGRLAQLEVRGDDQAAVRAAFDLSYDRLDPTTARLFRLLGLVPGPDFAAGAAAALMACPLAEAEQHLDALTAANLVFPSATGRFQFHDLLRDYAAARSGEDADARPAELRLWDFLLHTARAAADLLYPDVTRLPLPEPVAGSAPLAPAGEAAALDWLDAERPGLVAAALRARERGLGRYAWQLADNLRGYFWGRADAVEGLAVCEAALAAARDEADPGAEATVLDLMGLIHFVRGDYRTAWRHHEEALQISRHTGDLETQARCLHNLGRVSAQLGSAGQSARYHREALELARRTGNLDAEALNTNYIGTARLSAGRVDLAMRWHLRALELAHRTGNQSVLVRVIGALGNAAWHQGELSVAVALYRECLRLARRLGNRYLETNSLICLAETLCDTGDYDRAIGHAELAVRLGRESGEQRHEVGGAEIIATALLRGGRTEGVVEAYQEALRRAREIDFRYGEISILTALAAAYRIVGDPGRAVDHAEQALRAMSQVGERSIEGRALVELAHGHLELGDRHRAATELDRALRVARTAGTRLTEARARYVYGLLCRAERDDPAAERHWRAALEVCTQVGAAEAGPIRALLSGAGPTESGPAPTDVPELPSAGGGPVSR
ncbi:BTAD domain-containing putative transcriptional regulator [Micromonospora sp. NPDC049559]|uniref:AfsR/SARP family transcriptional regulator n=1 Tax=Micromonospora sp. NPDC049559 TaxID=3155923 RepID=UPI0034229E53